MSDRSDLLSTLLAFHVRLWLGGLLLAILVPVSLVAAALNFVRGLGPDAGPYAAVHDHAARLDAQIRGLERAPREPRQRDETAAGRRPRMSA